MIFGSVTPNRVAVLEVTLHGTGGQQQRIEAAVDTGFNGFLTLAPVLVSQLGLVVQAPTSAALADGTQVLFDIVVVTMMWDGQLRPVPALVAAGGSLIGMSLLLGYHLGIDVVDGGQVTITALP